MSFNEQNTVEYDSVKWNNMQATLDNAEKGFINSREFIKELGQIAKETLQSDKVNLNQIFDILADSKPYFTLKCAHNRPIC